MSFLKKEPGLLIALSLTLALGVFAGVRYAFRAPSTPSDNSEASLTPQERMSKSVLRDQRIMGEWINTKGYSIWFYPDGNGLTKSNRAGDPAERSFKWRTQEEHLITESVSGDALPWPPKSHSYEYSYQSDNFINGAAYLVITKSVATDGIHPITEQPARWEFERR